MPYDRVKEFLQEQISQIRAAGLYKGERVLTSPQRARVGVAGRDTLLNMCANNYLGLADHPEVREAARQAVDRWGYGMASVRFICGTQQLHKDLESSLADFLGCEDTILYSSCWDANGGLFETILAAEDAVISDELNHASIIDGVRLCKAQRFRYRNNDMADLEAKLQEARSARFRLIATDGVFSMDGIIANLPAICELADRYDAMVMVDDSHAVGFLGPGGRGTAEYHGVTGRIDVLTGTLGKALGGGSGGYTCAQAGDRGNLAAAVAALPVFQLAAAADRGGVAQVAGIAYALHGASRQAGDEHGLVPPGNDRRRFPDRGRRTPNRADHARRRGAGRADGGAAFGRGSLRDRLFLSRGAARQGPHPHAGLRSPQPRGLGVRRGGVQAGEGADWITVLAHSFDASIRM